MQLNLLKAQFLKRYKRFFVDINLNEQPVVAHLANTGSMKTCYEAGDLCFVSPATNPERKLKYSVELIERNQALIMVNTSLTNHLVHEALKSKAIPELAIYDEIKPEVKWGDSRLDFHLKKSSQELYLEVKNVTLKMDGQAQFPDAKTERGQKHLQELMKIKKTGKEAAILFVVSRNDCDVFSAAESIDPKYAELLRNAQSKGVMILAYALDFQLPHVMLKHKIQVKL